MPAKRWLNGLTALVVFFVMQSAWAGIRLEGTRVVYRAGERDATVRVTNVNPRAVLVQAWADSDQDGIIGTGSAPFAVMPPVFRMEGGRERMLRLVETGTDHSDVEQVYWLNVQEIPEAAEDERNLLRLAVRTRIKIFLRPRALDADGAAQAPSQLVWSVADANGRLQVYNPTPYFVTLRKATIKTAAGDIEGSDPPMIAPHQRVELSTPAARSLQGATSVSFSIINDYGAVKELSAPLDPPTR